MIRKSSKINTNGPITVVVCCVQTLRTLFVGFAPHCGKHLLKGFQVQFAWTGQLISFPALWHDITTTQVQNFFFSRQKKEKIVVVIIQLHVFLFNTAKFPVFISVDCSATIILSVDYSSIQRIRSGDCSKLSESVKWSLMGMELHKYRNSDNC